MLLFITASACTFLSSRIVKTAEQTPHSGTNRQTYPVAPVFKEFYESHGGEKIFGPAISPLIESGRIQSQFFEAVLLTYDPFKPESDEIYLAPLGVMLGFSEPPIDTPVTADQVYINGHFVFPEFLHFFQKMGGEAVVGRPLTEAHHNPAKDRIEQYFENLGFYRFTFDAPGTVRLLAYGAYACEDACQYSPSSASIPSIQGVLPQPFAPEAARLGIGVTGLTLAGPHLAADGNLEVIFENVVMVLETEKRRPAHELTFQLWLPDISRGLPANPLGFAHRSWLPFVIDLFPRMGINTQNEGLNSIFGPVIIKSGSPMKAYVTLRPIARMVGIIPDTPVEEDDFPLMEFYRIRGRKGYHVPVLFYQFLNKYGGINFSGPPITEPFILEDGVFRQCFENLCLDFNVLGQVPQIKFAALGEVYQRLYFSQMESEVHSINEGGFEMYVRESNPYISPEQMMKIQVEIKKDGVPFKDQRPYVILTLPGKLNQRLQFPSTDQNGLTSLILPQIPVSNATIIPYEVCMEFPGIERLCVEDHFLVISLK